VNGGEKTGEIAAKGWIFERMWCMLQGMRRRVINRVMGRRRERRLAQELELRFRAQLDARTEAAARMADDLRQA
jgi:hypothetical protein